MSDDSILKDEGYSALDQGRVEAAVREFLLAIGEDPNREGLLETPGRVARACEEIFGGMQEDPSLHLLKQFNEPGNDNMVIVRDIPFNSTCEHHLLPFTGKAHIATGASRVFPSSRAASRATPVVRSCRNA